MVTVNQSSEFEVLGRKGNQYLVIVPEGYGQIFCSTYWLERDWQLLGSLELNCPVRIIYSDEVG
jgi:hypothetical protein